MRVYHSIQYPSAQRKSPRFQFKSPYGGLDLWLSQVSQQNPLLCTKFYNFLKPGKNFNQNFQIVFINLIGHRQYAYNISISVCEIDNSSRLCISKTTNIFHFVFIIGNRKRFSASITCAAIQYFSTPIPISKKLVISTYYNKMFC
jgi:hypothetical protein